MNLKIESIQNSRVKQWKQLLERKGRVKQNKFIIEGALLIEEALQHEYPLETIVYTQQAGIPEQLKEWYGDKDIEWVEVTEAIMDACTATETPQGIFAIVPMFSWEENALLHKSNSLVVVVDGIQDPGNLGTIIRSADAVGADGVIIGKGSVDLYNPKTIRSTMGSIFHRPVILTDLLELLPLAQEHHIQMYNATPSGDLSCYDADFTKNSWIIVGNEARGVSSAVDKLADRRIRIPMQGDAESLNVAMAATVLLFEASRQRN